MDYLKYKPKLTRDVVVSLTSKGELG